MVVIIFFLYEMFGTQIMSCILGTKLSEDCCKYGSENINDEILSKAASIYGDARRHVEKEQEDFNRLLYSQVNLLKYIFGKVYEFLLLRWEEYCNNSPYYCLTVCVANLFEEGIRYP